MQKLARKWGPHQRGTRVTTDPAEADEAPGQSRRWPVLLVGATRFAWLKQEGYFGGGPSAEDPDGGGELSGEAADLVKEADLPPQQGHVLTKAEAAEADQKRCAEGEADADEPETPPSMQGLDHLTNDLALGEPGGGSDDGR